ncbi:Inner membrane ABC transporter permease protein ycjP [Chlamydia abortus]|uniref:Carbohydrate ABC transporter permease n=1 Tax=Paenibacillus residui TaxID=629724 RepID=A0ABW3D7B8_9BACL|nr:carbohydrate ABC transporter permease [Paenibacillus sp. 32O-W]SHE13854.1 Inner membrane ABC transporter permease protein ycjP [Chlamydia abortus]
MTAITRQWVKPMWRKLRRVRMVKPGRVVLHLVMLVLVVLTSAPIVYVISTAFKPLDELFMYPPRFWVMKPTLKNFSDLFIATDGMLVPFTRYVFNSVLTTVATVLGSVVICSMGAFIVSKYKLPGTGFLFALIISALMFSPQVTQIPTYFVISNLDLIDSYWALILPKLAVPYNFFLMKQFMDQIPEATLEAARVDGANEWTSFWKVVMPMVKPAWITVVIFTFIANWNDFFTPLIYTTSEAMKTLPLAMAGVSNGTVGRMGAAAAGAFVTTIPTIILFVILQRQVMDTMAHSGIKS